MDKRKSNRSLLLIASAVLITGGAFRVKASASPSCFQGTNDCWKGFIPGNCIGTLPNGGSGYCACQLPDGSSFGTWQCSPYGQ